MFLSVDWCVTFGTRVAVMENDNLREDEEENPVAWAIVWILKPMFVTNGLWHFRSRYCMLLCECVVLQLLAFHFSIYALV